MKFRVTEGERREAKLFSRQAWGTANKLARMEERGYRRQPDTALCIVFMSRADMVRKQHRLVKW